MSSSKFPKFKSTYEPKTAYGRDVVKPYFENNLTPSVNWMMGSNAEHKKTYGSDYGSEDVEAISREYVLWRDANGISANYNKGLMPWVEQVRASAAQGGVPGAAVPYTPPVAATPVGAANTVNPTALSQGNAMQGTIKPAVKPMAQTGRNGVVTQNNAAGTQGTAVGVNTSNEQGTAAVAQNNGTVANNAGAEVTSPTTQVAAPAGQNNAAVGGTATAQTGKSDALWSADSFYAQIAKNKAIDNAKLDGSGLPAATVEAIKAQSGLDNVGKNYQAAVKQAETDYARAQSRFGQNAEYLAQSGLSNSGFSDASDNAAYAAMQQAKVSAGENALAAQAEGQKTLWQRVAEEQTKLKAETQERENELLTFVTSKGLSGQEAINYLTANGMDAARAADLVSSQVDPLYNANLDKAAASYIEAIQKGASPAEAKLILGANGYGTLVSAAVEKANGIMNSEEYKNAQDNTNTTDIATGKNLYADLKEDGKTENYIKDHLTSQGYNYDDIKTSYDSDNAEQLGVIFGRLNGGEESDIDGAEAEIKSTLGIGDVEWEHYSQQGNLGAFMRKKADTVYADNQTLRSKVYTESLVYEINNIDETEYELVADGQKIIDEYARKGVLTGENLTKVRNALADKLIVKGSGFEGYGTVYGESGYASEGAIGFNVNGKTFNVSIEEMSPPNGALWNKLDGGVEVAVVKDGNGAEQLMVYFTDVDGNKICGMVNKTTGGELYNAMVNKYRGVGYRKASGRTAKR